MIYLFKDIESYERVQGPDTTIVLSDDLTTIPRQLSTQGLFKAETQDTDIAVIAPPSFGVKDVLISFITLNVPVEQVKIVSDDPVELPQTYTPTVYAESAYLAMKPKVLDDVQGIQVAHLINQAPAAPESIDWNPVDGDNYAEAD